MRVNLDDLPPQYQQQAERQLAETKPSSEASLQAQCERYLLMSGYLRMTSNNAKLVADGTAQPKGFFGHLQETRGNPQMPDLWVRDGQKPDLYVELKAKKRYQPGQREWIDMGQWKVAFTFNEFVVIFETWRNGNAEESDSTGPVQEGCAENGGAPDSAEQCPAPIPQDDGTGIGPGEHLGDQRQSVAEIPGSILPTEEDPGANDGDRKSYRGRGRGGRKQWRRRK